MEYFQGNFPFPAYFANFGLSPPPCPPPSSSSIDLVLYVHIVFTKALDGDCMSAPEAILHTTM